MYEDEHLFVVDKTAGVVVHRLGDAGREADVAAQIEAVGDEAQPPLHLVAGRTGRVERFRVVVRRVPLTGASTAGEPVVAADRVLVTTSVAGGTSTVHLFAPR